MLLKDGSCPVITVNKRVLTGAARGDWERVSPTPQGCPASSKALLALGPHTGAPAKKVPTQQVASASWGRWEKGVFVQQSAKGLSCFLMKLDKGHHSQVLRSRQQRNFAPVTCSTPQRQITEIRGARVMPGGVTCH